MRCPSNVKSSGIVFHSNEIVIYSVLSGDLKGCMRKDPLGTD